MNMHRIGNIDLYRPNKMVGEELFVQEAGYHLSKLNLPTVIREQSEIERALQAYYDYCFKCSGQCCRILHYANWLSFFLAR